MNTAAFSHGFVTKCAALGLSPEQSVTLFVKCAGGGIDFGKMWENLKGSFTKGPEVDWRGVLSNPLSTAALGTGAGALTGGLLGGGWGALGGGLAGGGLGLYSGLGSWPGSAKPAPSSTPAPTPKPAPVPKPTPVPKPALPRGSPGPVGHTGDSFSGKDFARETGKDIVGLPSQLTFAALRAYPAFSNPAAVLAAGGDKLTAARLAAGGAGYSKALPLASLALSLSGAVQGAYNPDEAAAASLDAAARGSTLANAFGGAINPYQGGKNIGAAGNLAVQWLYGGGKFNPVSYGDSDAAIKKFFADRAARLRR